MPELTLSNIEGTLIHFRTGRRLVLNALLEHITSGKNILNPFIMLSRLFGRLKSADSILEKIKRKGIIINDISEIPEKIPDVLGFRVIAENNDELFTIDKFLCKQFEVVTRQDNVSRPGEYGNREILYSLRYHVGNVAYPFEIQLRTFLQHYWSVQSFHLFHKKAKEVAEEYKDILLSLNKTLKDAEEISKNLLASQPVPISSKNPFFNNLPFLTKINLIVVEPGEQFRSHHVLPLSGNDQDDHKAIVNKKLQLYTSYPNSAIVECSCLNFSSFILNESHVRVPVDRLNEVVF